MLSYKYNIFINNWNNSTFIAFIGDDWWISKKAIKNSRVHIICNVLTMSNVVDLWVISIKVIK